MDKIPIGFVAPGQLLTCSEAMIAQEGLDNIKRHFGLMKSYPVKTGLGTFDVIYVEAESHQEAIDKYFKRNKQ
jgi:hypothetical protein